MLTKAFLIWAMHFAAAESGLPPANELPIIEYKSSEAIIADTQQDALAYYELEAGNKHIVLNYNCQAMETLDCKGILIHEMTHYLQDMAGKYAGMICIRPNEKLAYRVEDAFLKRFGSSLAQQGITQADIIGFSSCGQDYD